MPIDEKFGEGHGFVYVMSYPGDTLLKIGHANNVEARVKEIGGTMAPRNPIPVASFFCAKRRHLVEQAAHRLLADRRRNGEWFEVTVAQAMGAIREGAKELGILIEIVLDPAIEGVKLAKKPQDPIQVFDAESLKEGYGAIYVMSPSLNELSSFQIISAVNYAEAMSKLNNILFPVKAFACCEDRLLLWQKIHAILSIRRDGAWFNTSIDEVVAAIRRGGRDLNMELRELFLA